MPGTAVANATGKAVLFKTGLHSHKYHWIKATVSVDPSSQSLGVGLVHRVSVGETFVANCMCVCVC